MHPCTRVAYAASDYIYSGFVSSCRNGNYGKLVSLISKGLTSVHQEKMKNLNAGKLVFKLLTLFLL